MVAKLEKPEEDCVDVLNMVLKERVKFKKFYERIELDISARYVLYDEQRGCPSGMPPLVLRDYVDSDAEADDRKISLIGLYNPKEDKYPYKELERLRKKNKLLACPVCGELGRPRTLDHCLPKTAYPEFAINLLNLVPACDWCQGEKLVDYKNSTGSRSFIHPYFDEVDRALYTIIFKKPYLTPVISLEICKDLPLDLQVLVTSHLKGIGFWERFKEYFESSYQGIIRIASKARNGDRITVTKAIESSCLLAVEKGVNCWDAVLYRSILDDVDLLDFLENGKLSEFP